MSTCNFCKAADFSFFHLIKELPWSYVYIWEYQKDFPIRLIVSFKSHKEELFELTDEELLGFMRDCSHVAEAMTQAFSFDKVNYGIAGDGQRHLHMHIVGKVRDGFMWRNMFNTRIEETDEGRVTSEELQNLIDRILPYL